LFAHKHLEFKLVVVFMILLVAPCLVAPRLGCPNRSVARAHLVLVLILQNEVLMYVVSKLLTLLRLDLLLILDASRHVIQLVLALN
jgi:hypothetical protein